MKVKTSKGITLTALIITIIVLLILAGVSIVTLTGENGLLNKAETSKETSERAELIEQIQLDIFNKQTEKQSGNLTQDELKAILINYVENLETDIKYDESDTSKIASIVTKKGNYKISIGEIWSENITAGGIEEIPIESEVVKQAEAAMPAEASIKEGTTEESGIVMVDSNENEWVWIEVPDSIYSEETKNDPNTSNIKADLIAYTTDYNKGNPDEWYALYYDSTEGEYYFKKGSDSNLNSEYKLLNNGCGLTYYEYNATYNKMLKSVYENKGFYISRYEIGDSIATVNNITRSDSTGAANTPVSKVDQIPYNYVSCSEAQILSSSMATGEKTSSLLFGLQWDLVCKYLEEKSDLEKEDINSNSKRWGNYHNSSLILKSGKYHTRPDSTLPWVAYDENRGYVTDSDSDILLTTGASEDTKKMNIYDLAGNLGEWTLEGGGHDEGDGARFRGRGYDKSSWGMSWCDEETIYRGLEFVGFRVSLY